MAKSKSAKLIERLSGKDYSSKMKNLLTNYVRQPSTWLGLAKLGAAMGFYSSGLGGELGSVIVAIFGVIDVIRNERK
jgi:hypothetical protein